MNGSPAPGSFAGLRPTAPEPVPSRPASFNTQFSSPASWGSLEESISQVFSPKPIVEVAAPKPGEFSIGLNHQKEISNFKMPIGTQIQKLQETLKQFSPDLVSESKTDDVTTTAPAKKALNKEELADNILERADNARKTVHKEGKDLYGAVFGLFKEDMFFKHLTPEQKKKKAEKEAKEKEKNANKKSFFEAMAQSAMALENAMMKLLAELADRLGVGGKSLAEKNALLGVKGRNLSYAGVNSAYHIKAMHDALIDQMNAQKAAQSKAAPPSGPSAGKKKTDYFMDRNSSMSRQGQSAYSAAG